MYIENDEKCGNVKPHTHIQFIDFIFNVFFYASFCALFSFCCRLNTPSTLCALCALCVPLFDVSQSIIHYYINGTRHIWYCVHCHTTFSRSGVHHSMTVYGLWFWFWFKFGFYDLRTYYLLFIHTVCMYAEASRTQCSQFLIGIHRKPWTFPIWSCFAILYRLPSNPCDFFFFRFFWHSFFSLVCWPFHWQCADALTERDSANGKRAKWNGKICIWNRCVVSFFAFLVYRINEYVLLPSFPKCCCLLMMFSLLYLTSIFYPFHKLILLSELIWFLLYFIFWNSFHFIFFFWRYLQYANGWLSSIYPSGVLWKWFSFYFVCFHCSLSTFDSRICWFDSLFHNSLLSVKTDVWIKRVNLSTPNFSNFSSAMNFTLIRGSNTNDK